jgi:hypothetical protein
MMGSTEQQERTASEETLVTTNRVLDEIVVTERSPFAASAPTRERRGGLH